MTYWKKVWDFLTYVVSVAGIVIFLWGHPPIREAVCPVTKQFLSVAALPVNCRPKVVEAKLESAIELKDPPTETYWKELFQGFTIYVSPKLLEDQAAAGKALYHIQFTLEEVARLVPGSRLAALQKIPIWLEFGKFEVEAKIDNPETAGIDNEIAGVYYTSAEWLRRNGYNPDKAGGIGIYDLPDFVQYSTGEQLIVMVHELAHAYHDQVLGKTHRGILSAYQQAMNQKRYDAVKDRSGKKVRAYAATNRDEYFAELTVSYFVENDYYPFDRADLAVHDPVGYRLMKKSWN